MESSTFCAVSCAIRCAKSIPAYSPTKVILEAELSAFGRRFRNRWTTWVYPAKVPAPALKVPARANAIEGLKGLDWGRTLRSVRVNDAETEWVLRPYMNTAKKRRLL